MIKSITNSDSKELPSPNGYALSETGTTTFDKPIQDKPVSTQVTESETPEIKPNTAELDTNKDPNLGIDDLKKP